MVKVKNYFSQNKAIIKWLVIVFLAWRLGLTFFAFLGVKLIPARIDYLGGGVSSYFENPLIWAWANFDGVHYLTIARQGYLQLQQALFPFYPFLIRFLARLLKSYLFSGLLISHLSFLISLFFFYQLIRLDFEEKIAKRSLFYLLLFPTAFYFGSLYTESLFLMLVLGSFYAARKKKWALAGILGAFASATRLVGIFLFPALLIEWWSQTSPASPSRPRLDSVEDGSARRGRANIKHQASSKFKNALPLFLIILGLLFYMWYLKKTVGDPFYFIHVQPLFGAERTGGKIILLYQVLWRYFKMILTTKADVLYFTVWLELTSSLLFLVLLIFSYFRFRLSYFTFMFLAYITPTLTGTFSSLPRYVLVLFPGFILLASWAEKHRWLKILYPIIGGILLIVSAILFTRGYWVA